jgi:sigma-B regulation protein RsbU (phosphoserine phosphatase)
MDAMLDEAPCGFLVFTAEGAISSINRTMAHWLGYGLTDLKGKKLESLMSIASRIFYQTHFFPLLALHGRAEEIFMNLIAKDGAQLPVLVNAKRVDDEGCTSYHCALMLVHQRKKFEGELVRARELAQDALAQNVELQTATRALEESRRDLDQRLTRLSVMNKDLAQFSKVISHDMQEPVRKMAIFTDIILRESTSSDSNNIRYAAGRVHAANIRMQRLIECLNQFVSIDTDMQQMQPCELNTIVELARRQVLARPESGDIRITGSGLPIVHGRCEQLQLLFYHLMLNAAQARNPGTSTTHIHITADIVPQNSYRSMESSYHYVDFVRISITDDGQGFSPEYNEYVFQLFKKLNQNETGLGFGLALCRKIADSHHGSISVHAEPGRGATFTLLLPMAVPELPRCNV